MSSFGDLKHPAGFTQFEYVNADAPKGGTARDAASGTFDNFNRVVAGVKGSLAVGIDLIYETLLVSSLDEVATGYGLLAEAVRFPADFSSATYRLRQQATWHDGTPVTSDDVIFSFEAFKKYSPELSAYYRHVIKAEKTGNREVTFTAASGNRELPRIIGELTVLPKRWWEGTDTNGKKRNIGETTLEPAAWQRTLSHQGFFPPDTISSTSASKIIGAVALMSMSASIILTSGATNISAIRPPHLKRSRGTLLIGELRIAPRTGQPPTIFRRSATNEFCSKSFPFATLASCRPSPSTSGAKNFRIPSCGWRSTMRLTLRK